MSISRFSAHRPVFTIMATLVIVVLFGFIALIRLPVDLMPDISYPTLSISTSYGNSSPEIVEQLVSRPIEEAMSAVPGVEEIFLLLVGRVEQRTAFVRLGHRPGGGGHRHPRPARPGHPPPAG